MCGFSHSTLVTTPLRVMGFSPSYSAAKEWCPKDGVAAAISAARKNKNRIEKGPPNGADHLPVYFVKRCLTSLILHAACAPGDSNPTRSTTCASAVEPFMCVTIY